jgi:tRNA pseudouridine55 synthase
MHGVLIIDKPAGPTSAEIVRLVKARIGRNTRVGHLGTLDPFASGVLPILVGEGTKLAPFLQEGEKEYSGLIAFGSETDTLDPTGQVIRTADVPALEAARLHELATRFTGVIEQIPPIFSALKRDGVPLYKLARGGGEVAPPAPRRVEIRRLELIAEGPAAIRFAVACSSGMYVRSLARDLGLALDSAAHLAALRRIRNGAFAEDRSVALVAAMEQLERGNVSSLISLRATLPDLPEIELDSALERRLRNGDSYALAGQVPRDADPSVRGRFKVIARGELVAVAEATSRATASILRVFNG